MWKKWLFATVVLVGWGVLKANTPSGCGSCCVLSGESLSRPSANVTAGERSEPQDLSAATR